MGSDYMGSQNVMGSKYGSNISVVTAGLISLYSLQ
jgi:hypothetical protein